MKHTTFLAVLIVFFHWFVISAKGEEPKRIINYPIVKFYDFNHPRTREEVLNAYPWRVDVKDGVDAIEARIIAQYEIINRDLDRDYDVTKAKVIEENNQQCVVQIPAKLSISYRKIPLRYLVTIDKRSGKVKSLEEDAKGPLP